MERKPHRHGHRRGRAEAAASQRQGAPAASYPSHTFLPHVCYHGGMPHDGQAPVPGFLPSGNAETQRAQHDACQRMCTLHSGSCPSEQQFVVLMTCVPIGCRSGTDTGPSEKPRRPSRRSGQPRCACDSLRFPATLLFSCLLGHAALWTPVFVASLANSDLEPTSCRLAFSACRYGRQQAGKHIGIRRSINRILQPSIYDCVKYADGGAAGGETLSTRTSHISKRVVTH